MRKLALAAVAIGAISAATIAAAEAHWRGDWHGGWGGPGVGFGLAAGALALGAIAASASPYYGLDYYYGPRYYRPALTPTMAGPFITDLAIIVGVRPPTRQRRPGSSGPFRRERGLASFSLGRPVAPP